MRRMHSTFLLLALLLANAASILFFRYFITVDGPMHVLHASLMEAPWSSQSHVSQGITYGSAAMSTWLGHRVLMILLLLCTPELAHNFFAALVSCAVVLSVVAFLRAHGTQIGPAILWLAPLTFSILLIMGLFHFLLGVAVGFGSVAWWKSRAASPRSRWAGLLLGAALAWWAHRSAPIVLCVLFLPTLLGELQKERNTALVSERRSILWRMAIIGTVVVVSVLQLDRVVHWISLPNPRDLPAFNEAFLLRPLLLLDHAKEKWLVSSIGILLLISIGVAAWARWCIGRKVLWHDTFLAFFIGLTITSWLYHSPNGRQLFISERCQWLALLMLVVWLVAIADAHRGWVAHAIGGAAICALPLHFIRLVQAEASFAELRRSHISMIEACKALEPGSLVLPVMVDHNWLLQHLDAYMAIEHDGILLLPNERLGLITPSAETADPNLLRLSREPSWLARHWRSGIPKQVDQIFFIGGDIERTVNKHPWPVLLKDRYRSNFDNGYTRIYTAVGAPLP